MRRAALLLLAAATTACSGSFVAETQVFDESRRIAPGVLRLYVQGGISPPDVRRVDLRPIGARTVAVQARERVEEGDSPAVASIHCLDVTVPDDVARRKLVDADGEPLQWWGHLTPGEELHDGCPRLKGTVVDEFEPIPER